jgi:hypothetical protein
MDYPCHCQIAQRIPSHASFSILLSILNTLHCITSPTMIELDDIIMDKLMAELDLEHENGALHALAGLRRWCSGQG